MARKKKSDARPALQYSVIAAAVFVCLFYAAAGLGYVWHSNRNDHLEEMIRAAERKLNRLVPERENLQSQVSRLQSDDYLRTRLPEFGLEEANIEQYLYVPDPDPDPPSKQPPYFAVRPGGSSRTAMPGRNLRP